MGSGEAWVTFSYMGLASWPPIFHFLPRQGVKRKRENANTSFLPLRRFVLQLISLAGLHSTATATAELSRAFRTDGMLAYVNLVQRREKELGVDVLTHQKWSGAAYVDGILGVVQSGSSSSKSMGEGNTESGE